MEFNVERRLSKRVVKNSEDIAQCENNGKFHMILSGNRVDQLKMASWGQFELAAVAVE